MFEHVVSSGCSLTEGEELLDLDRRYTRVLASGLNKAKLTCFAKTGVSNEVISQNIINGLIHLKDRCRPDNTLVVVQWTFASRLNYYGKNHGFFTLANFNMTPSMRKRKIIAGHTATFFEDSFDDMYSVKSYYDYHTDPEYVSYNLVKLVHHTESFLKSKGYKYVFVFAIDDEKEIFDLTPESFQHMHKYAFIKGYIPPYYYMISDVDKTNIFPTCFMNFTFRNKFPLGPMEHPLEEAHVAYGKLLLNYVKNKFNV